MRFGAAAVVNAERIKLTTLRSPMVSAGAAAALSLALAALQAANRGPYSALSAPDAALGAAVFGVPVLMVVSAMTLTTEYRTQMVRTTLLATPDRTRVLCAKAVVSAVFCAVVAALTALGSIVVAGLAAEPGAARQLTLGQLGVWRTTAAIGLYAALAAVLAVGVAALVRHTAGAVTLLLLWPLLVEPLLGNLPPIGAQLGPYLPFGNAFRFLEVQWLFPGYDAAWGPVGAICYFAAVSAAVFGVALVTMNRRDA
ncbi:ABC transporter permease [Mycobacterium sp. Y57]|uniref:ABC transporter permease n=1 Tax=Mycolicibacterium xanthum TaxID=2796469 RepID=UPI001C865028|nr:ABC transporter permease [Mycolicibacterium xanthum]MBX7431985.1 ABC transporter permease [Mycolicibacterium xanthum]